MLMLREVLIGVLSGAVYCFVEPPITIDWIVVALVSLQIFGYQVLLGNGCDLYRRSVINWYAQVIAVGAYVTLGFWSGLLVGPFVIVMIVNLAVLLFTGRRNLAADEPEFLIFTLIPILIFAAVIATSNHLGMSYALFNGSTMLLWYGEAIHEILRIKK